MFGVVALVVWGVVGARAWLGRVGRCRCVRDWRGRPHHGFLLLRVPPYHWDLRTGDWGAEYVGCTEHRSTVSSIAVCRFADRCAADRGDGGFAGPGGPEHRPPFRATGFCFRICRSCRESAAWRNRKVVRRGWHGRLLLRLRRCRPVYRPCSDRDLLHSERAAAGPVARTQLDWNHYRFKAGPPIVPAYKFVFAEDPTGVHVTSSRVYSGQMVVRPAG